MSIRDAILGFLSWKPFTGYELKKLFADSLSFHWSGNSNQIYGTLIQLHKDGAVSIEVQQQEKYPARKVYAITDKGSEELRAWLLGEPGLPEVKNHFHIQLAWAEFLSGTELDALFAGYELLLSNQILMYREQASRGNPGPARSPRERLVWKRIEEGRLAAYEAELAWARALRKELSEGEAGRLPDKVKVEE
jgi:PadR family transcriptional regulator, regulatory protein AphA